MFTLLRSLQRLRAQVGRPRPGPASLGIRHVDAGSCNGCEHELNAATNPYYDLQRLGVNIVASPRHADLLAVTGPVTTRMRDAVMRAHAAMPEPRRVAAVGNCAMGCGVLGLSSEHIGGVGSVLPVDVCIPGCPPDPEAILEALRRGIARNASRRATIAGTGIRPQPSATDRYEPGPPTDSVAPATSIHRWLSTWLRRPRPRTRRCD
jgi:Ni,Fe-hydrogenase III small subunit